MNSKTTQYLIVGAVLLLLAPGVGISRPAKFPTILSVREQAATINGIIDKRLDTLLPGVMRTTGIDMWVILCNEDNYDPVFKSMAPLDAWFPITQILVLYDRGPGKDVERLNLSRSDMRGLFEDAWDYRVWDKEKKESQWDALARVVRERNPKKIGINQSSVIWAADGLSISLKEKLIETIGPQYARRLVSAEALATLWLETLLDEELDIYQTVVVLAHAIIAKTFSSEMITPGVTTLEDLLYSHVQLIDDLGVENYAWPSFRRRWRPPEITEQYGPDDTVIRRGDVLQCDTGIRYLRYYTDHAEWAYVLRPGETDAPEGFRKLMAEGNRLQDVFVSQFREGLTGNQLLANILAETERRNIPAPKIYSHSIGYFLHEPGPLIGLPWEQKDTQGRGEVALVPNSTFTAELSVGAPLAELQGEVLRMGMEQVIAFTAKGTYFLDGRQTEFHIVK